MGWSATLQDAKVVAEGLLLGGIRYLVPHGFFYTTHGLPKHDAPPSFFFQLPAWEHFGVLTGRLDRIAAAFEGTHMDAQVLVVDPHSGIPTAEQLDTYQQLTHGLLAAHVDFLVADTDILESGQVADGSLRVRDLTVRTVVVPPMRAVEEPLRDWLERFEAAGGEVLRLADAAGSAAAVAHLAERFGAALGLRAASGDGDRVYAVTRTDGERRTWFLLNTAGTPCQLELSGPAGLREVCLDCGLPNPGESSVGGAAAGAPSAGRPSGDGNAWHLTGAADGWRRALAPFESVLLVEEAPRSRGQDAAGQDPAGQGRAGQGRAEGGSPDQGVTANDVERIVSTTGAVASVHLQIPEQVAVRPLHRNLLRLGTWRLSLRDGAGVSTSGGETPVPAVPLATQLAMAGQAFVPRYQPGFGVMPSWHQPELTAVYRYDFECAYEGPVELVMEPGSVEGEWALAVNGSAPLTAGDLGATEAHVRGSLAVDVTALVRSGGNQLELTVTTDRRDGGLLNPLYLAGDFGVRLDPVTLVERPVRGRFDAWEANGLPFYAGAVEYETQVEVEGVSTCGEVRLELIFPGPFQDAVEVSCNGSAWLPALWSPYVVQIPAAQLREGANDVKLRVYTSLVRPFDGLRWNIEAHRYEPVDPADPATKR